MDPFVKQATRLMRERPGYVVACTACYLAIMVLALCITAIPVIL